MKLDEFVKRHNMAAYRVFVVFFATILAGSIIGVNKYYKQKEQKLIKNSRYMEKKSQYEKAKREYINAELEFRRVRDSLNAVEKMQKSK